MKFNPFNPNSVVAPNLFAGRTSQVIDVCKKLSLIKHKMPASFFVYGERGIGKTALVKLIKSIAESNDAALGQVKMLTSYYLAENGQDIGSVLEESINKLTDQMSSDFIEKLSKRLGNLFKNGKFSIGAYGINASVEIKEGHKREITIKDQSVSILSNIIKAMHEEGEDKKDGILIIIDEVHNLKDKVQVASVLRNIVTTLDVEGLGSISFLLVGYKEDKEAFFNGDPSAHRTFDSIPLETMPDKEAVDVLKKGFEQITLKYDEDMLIRNVTVAGGYPHSLQILGHKVVEIDTDNLIDQKDWDAAIIQTSVELTTKEFSRMYSFGKKTTVKDNILQLLAKKNSFISKKEIQDEFKSCNNVYQYFSSLKKNGAIKENEDGKISLQSQLFRTAILIDNFIQENANETKKYESQEPK